MATPQQVDEAAELAEKLHEQMFSAQPQTESEESVETNEPTEDVDTHEESVDELKERLRKSEARYESLRGKYDAEVPRYQKDINDFKEMFVQHVQQQNNSNLQQTVQEEPKSNPLIDKFKEEYGEDLFEVIKAITRQEVDPLLSERIKPVQQNVEAVEETQIKVAQSNFMNFLDKNVKGDWRKLWAGEDEGFMEFLNSPDPSGLYTYAQLAEHYNNEWDGDKLSKVFNIYFDSNKPSQREVARPDQEALIAPSRKTTNSSPNINDKKIWSKDAISEFQRLDRQGKYDADTSKAMWDDLLLASTEGRIR